MPNLTPVLVAALTLALTGCGGSDSTKEERLAVIRDNSTVKLESYAGNEPLRRAFAQGYANGKASSPSDRPAVNMGSPAEMAYTEGFLAAQMLNQGEYEEVEAIQAELEAALPPGVIPATGAHTQDRNP